VYTSPRLGNYSEALSTSAKIAELALLVDPSIRWLIQI